MSDHKLKFSAFLIQGLASLIIAFPAVLSGFVISWPSCTSKNYTSNSTVLSSPMTTIEISLLGSLNNVGSLLVTPFIGLALRKFGRKYSVMLYAVPYVIAWTTIYSTIYVPLIIMAIGIGGMGTVNQIIMSVYISEISHDSFRGAFTSFTVIFDLIGILLSYVLKGFLTYYQILHIYLSLSIIDIILFATLKKSPVFLIQNEREEIAWTIIYSTTYGSLVILAIGMSGMGLASITIISVYISEISHHSVRGAFTSFSVTFYLVGLLVAYVLGGFLTYYQVLLVYLSSSILNIILLATLKESPVFLMQNKMEEEAAKSIAFYRRVDVKSAEVNEEIKKIKLQLNLNEELFSEDDKDVNEELLKNQPDAALTFRGESEWQLLLKSESSKRALAACLITMVTTLMMGIIALQVYAEPLFREAVPSMDSYKCAIYLGLDMLLASLLSATLVDSFGRKNLLSVSSAASGFCALLLGIQLILHYAPHWYTVLIIYLYTFVFSLGANVVPFILPAEVFLPQVRGLCNSITTGSMWVTCFVSLLIFNPLVEAIGLGAVFCGFSVICFSGAIHTQICLPETKGLSADAIQVLFVKKNINRII